MARTKTPVDGRELVGKHWPYDGPHSPDSVAEAARAMSELATYLGNATGPGNGQHTLRYGSQVYRVLGALKGALYSLGQVLDQLAVAENRIGEDPLTYHEDRRTPPTDVTTEVVEQLTAARKLLMHDWTSGEPRVPTVCGHLDQAHSASSILGYNG